MVRLPAQNVQKEMREAQGTRLASSVFSEQKEGLNVQYINLDVTYSYTHWD